MTMRAKIFVLLLLATLLAACGNKGRLYLPEDAPDSPRQSKRS
jgi:predicted small lipoprotein YifL